MSGIINNKVIIKQICVFLQDIFVSDKINYIHSDNRGYLAKIDRT